METKKRKTWSAKDTEYLKANYCSLKIEQIADKLGRTYQQVVKKAHKIGVNRRAATDYWSEDEDSILREHFENAPKNKITSLLPNRSWSAITQRGWSTLNLNRQTQDRYNINYRFFETWTPESAYIFGFIAADGYLKFDNGERNESSLQFELSDYDRDILDKIKLTLNYEGPITTTKRNTVKLSIGSRKICKDLINLGMPATNKTFDIKWPESLPENLHSHFVRGLFDGDGSIYPVKNAISFQILGTYDLLNSVTKYIPFESKRIPRKRDVCVFDIQYSHKKGIEFGKWIYKDATIYLDRKYEKYQQFKQLKETIV